MTTKLADPDWVNGDPASLRRWRENQPEVLNPVLPTGVTQTTIQPTDAFRGGLLFRSVEEQSGELILHFHGGGFVVGSPETHRVVGAWIAHVFGRPVLMPRYRLAPEHQLPAQARDGVAALEFATLEFGPATTLSGDSAGAMLALWAYCQSDARHRDTVADMMLLYAAYGQRPDQSQEISERLGLGPASMAAMYARVDPNGLIGKASEFSPLLPEFRLPAHVVVVGAGTDPLLPESHALIATHPDKTSLILAKDLPHGFLSVAHPGEAALSCLRQINQAIEKGRI